MITCVYPSTRCSVGHVTDVSDKCLPRTCDHLLPRHGAVGDPRLTLVPVADPHSCWCGELTYVRGRLWAQNRMCGVVGATIVFAKLLLTDADSQPEELPNIVCFRNVFRCKPRPRDCSSG